MIITSELAPREVPRKILPIFVLRKRKRVSRGRTGGEKTPRKDYRGIRAKKIGNTKNREGGTGGRNKKTSSEGKRKIPTGRLNRHGQMESPSERWRFVELLRLLSSLVITCKITMVVCRRRILRVSSLKEMVVSFVRILKHTLQHHSFPSPPFLVFFPGGGVLPSRRLMGMCRWMGSHFHSRIDYNVVAFLLELLERERTFSGFGR